ncbi:MAG: diguanylate cyclase [Burkholderiaceae bacterium]|nr:diguanylate cyclase [Roseateles sp.]MBV8470369.1 diguanylate cyclase [Burkholderiaceae bacterium]
MSVETRTRSLAQVLRRAQLSVALVALLTVGLVLTMGAALVLRSLLLHNLELASRSMAYSSEAAVTFRDRMATQALLKEFVEREQLADARVVLRSGEILAQYRRPSSNDWMTAKVQAWFPMYARSPVGSDADELDDVVEVHGDTKAYVQLLSWSLLGVMFSMGMTILAVLMVSRRLERVVLRPLGALAKHTRAVRDEHAYGRRAPSAEVREIDALGTDFNALLDEVQAHENELLRRHEALQTDHEVLSIQARVDALTGVCNRQFFESQLREAIARCAADGGILGLLFIDANGFKQINDRYGHEAGDRVLMALARHLGQVVRDTDLVGRLGGDEFVVLIRPLRLATDAQKVKQQVVSLLQSTPVMLDATHQVNLGVSVGVAVYPFDGAEVASLLRAADMAMYRDKIRQKGAFQLTAAGESPLLA